MLLQSHRGTSSSFWRDAWSANKHKVYPQQTASTVLQESNLQTFLPLIGWQTVDENTLVSVVFVTMNERLVGRVSRGSRRPAASALPSCPSSLKLRLVTRTSSVCDATFWPRLTLEHWPQMLHHFTRELLVWVRAQFVLFVFSEGDQLCSSLLCTDALCWGETWTPMFFSVRTRNTQWYGNKFIQCSWSLMSTQRYLLNSSGQESQETADRHT